MKYVDEYRDAAAVQAVLKQIAAVVTQPWVLMEICGGQTHSIIRHGLDQLLPKQLELVHGPGCPVCVTPLELIDQAIVIASRPEVIFCSFGDMLRVPGSEKDLFRVKAQGGDVRILYSPLDALKIAQENPDREVVFFGVGFETTAPANAMAVLQAQRLKIPNFSVLVSHVRVPPAIDVLLSSPRNRVQAFLAAGHVCAVMGTGNTRRWWSAMASPSSSPGSSLWTLRKGFSRRYSNWRAAGPRWRTPTIGRSPLRATSRRRQSSSKFLKR